MLRVGSFPASLRTQTEQAGLSRKLMMIFLSNQKALLKKSKQEESFIHKAVHCSIIYNNKRGLVNTLKV